MFHQLSFACQWTLHEDWGDYLTPKTVKQLQSFVGLANWAMEWLPNYGKLMKPLFQAIKTKLFCWTSTCDSAFNYVKELIYIFKAGSYAL